MEKVFDIRRSMMMRLHDSSVEPLMTEALSTTAPKRRIGLLMMAFKRIISGLPMGCFNGELWRFGGKCYVRMSDSEFNSLIVDCLEALEVPAEDMLFSDRVCRICRNEVMKKELLPMSNIMVFDNCVFDVERRMEYAFNPKYVQMSKVDYPHVYNERPYEFLNFLNYVLPDESLQSTLQEFLGSIFIDRSKAKMEQILILLGSGSNGKSVIFETVLGVLGRSNVSNFGLGALIGGNDRKHNLASMNGKRLNYCSEIRAIEIGRDSDALKTLISGEPTEARMLYGQNFMARNLPLLMANANRLPRITDMTHGMKRRLCIVSFDVKIPRGEQNPMLSEELRKEYPGIFNWIIEGKERFVHNGYKLSHIPDIDEVLRVHQEETSSPLRFMHLNSYYCGDPEKSSEPPVWRSMKWIYQRYTKWCLSDSVVPESIQKFGRELGMYGYQKRRTGRGYEYAIFGTEVKREVLEDGSDVREVIKRKKDRTASAWVTKEGTPMILGNRRLANALGVSLRVVDKCISNGWFEGCYEPVSSGWHAYDLKKCKAALLAHDIYKPASRIEELRSERARAALMRNTFNKRMEALELPYRKLKHKDRLREGFVWVPDDMSVNDLLRQEGGVLSDIADDEEIDLSD